MEIGWIMGGLFTILTVIYIAVALVAPEWVGIQGRAAKEIEASHRQKQGTDQEEVQSPDSNKI